MNYFLVGVAIICFALALGAQAKVDKLEKKLKERGILEEGWDKENG